MRPLAAVTSVFVLGAFALRCSDGGEAPASGTGGASSGGASSAGASSGGASSGGASSGGASSGGTGTGSGGLSTGLFSDVETILQKSCAPCHSGKGAAFDRVNLSNSDGSEALYMRLIRPIPDTVLACQGWTLADTQTPEMSLLPQIIQTNIADPDCRMPRMPYQCTQRGVPRDCLSGSDIAVIAAWVAAGAPGP